MTFSNRQCWSMSSQRIWPTFQRTFKENIRKSVEDLEFWLDGLHGACRLPGISLAISHSRAWRTRSNSRSAVNFHIYGIEFVICRGLTSLRPQRPAS